MTNRQIEIWKPAFFWQSWYMLKNRLWVKQYVFFSSTRLLDIDKYFVAVTVFPIFRKVFR